VHLSANDH